MGHARDGGQASDQASERAPDRHRPHSPGQIPARTPARGQSGLESRASTVGASLALAPDGAARTLTVRSCNRANLLPAWLARVEGGPTPVNYTGTGELKRVGSAPARRSSPPAAPASSARTAPPTPAMTAACCSRCVTAAAATTTSSTRSAPSPRSPTAAAIPSPLTSTSRSASSQAALAQFSRFTQVDPIAGGSANAYDYARQNPSREQLLAAVESGEAAASQSASSIFVQSSDQGSTSVCAGAARAEPADRTRSGTLPPFLDLVPPKDDHALLRVSSRQRFRSRVACFSATTSARSRPSSPIRYSSGSSRLKLEYAAAVVTTEDLSADLKQRGPGRGRDNCTVDAVGEVDPMYGVRACGSRGVQDEPPGGCTHVRQEGVRRPDVAQAIPALASSAVRPLVNAFCLPAGEFFRESPSAAPRSLDYQESRPVADAIACGKICFPKGRRCEPGASTDDGKTANAN